MAKFKHKNGGICEVFTELNIKRLREDKNYTEVLENASKNEIKTKQQDKVEKVVEVKEEVVDVEPLQ